MENKQSGLKRLRDLAELSQEQLAQMIDLSQTQISRYEAEPDNVPYGVLKRWVGACGTSLEEMEAFLEATLDPVDAGNPYKELHASLNLLEQFVSEPPPLPEGVPDLTVTPAKLMDSIQDWRRRPTVMLVGKFDSGKTRILNALIGGSRFPSQYQPTTSIVTFVRHQSDRPLWQSEDVWIMDAGFTASRWWDRDHCIEHRIVAGTYDTLKLYGTRKSKGDVEGAASALVYVDSPILLSCTIVDLPGYSANQTHSEIANSSLLLGDIFVYTSTAAGFIDEHDATYIAQLLRTMPKASGSPLSNLFIVATMANPSITDIALENLVSDGGSNLYNNLKDGILVEIAKEAGISTHVNESLLRSRIFTFWYESESRRAAFETAFQTLLSTDFPAGYKSRVDAEIRETKKTSRAFYRKQIEGYESMLNKLDEAKLKLQELEDREPERIARLTSKKEEVTTLILTLREETKLFIDDRLKPELTSPSIEAFIRNNYSDAKSAEKYAGSKLLEDLQSKLERELRHHSGKVKEALDTFLNDYEQNAVSWDSTGLHNVTVPFDAKGMFLGGIAGLGAFGALGVWAGAMGNLGGYILVAKAASLLTAIGLGVGSTAAVTFVAAIGGPITIGLGIFGAVMYGTKLMLGDHWQQRLSKRMSKQFADINYISKLQEGAKTVWDDSDAAFERGLAEMEKSYSEYRSKLTKLLETEVGGEGSAKKLAHILEQLEALQDFFGALPWRYSP